MIVLTISQIDKNGIITHDKIFKDYSTTLSKDMIHEMKIKTEKL